MQQQQQQQYAQMLGGGAPPGVPTTTVQVDGVTYPVYSFPVVRYLLRPAHYK